ncbi:MAG: hypothetical protein JW741_25080 [Sedimentisphaerales bacterium]|nr:hypothetical protein [Sedimentisphaerales bacterium]
MAVIALFSLVFVSSTAMAYMYNSDVQADVFFNPTGIYAAGGETYSITATGSVSVNLACFDGPYETDPDGTIVVAPDVGTGAYNFFTWSAGTVGVAPVVGAQKTVLSGWAAHLVDAPYGALVGGFSLNPTPTGFGDFSDGFDLIGSSGQITAPLSGGYLFLAINDINNDWDNAGAFQVSVVPVPGSLLLGALGLGVANWRLRRRKTA